MTATVRSPNGQFYTYNDCYFLDRRHNGSFVDLRDKENGRLIAQAPYEWLIEFERPCVIGSSPMNVETALDVLLNNDGAELRSAPGHRIAALKQKLRKFNQQRRTWK